MHLVKIIWGYEAFKKAEWKYSLIFLLNSVRTVKINHYGQLFQKIELVEDGRIEFQFSDTAPYILNYNKNYTLKWRLSMIKSNTRDYVEVNRG